MNVLEDILCGVREDLALRQAKTPLEQLKERARRQPEARDILAALRHEPHAVSVIAELKRACPAKGVLSPISKPAALAAAYEAGGAKAISVMTESRFFEGSLADLGAVRSAVDVPIIHKDFVISSYQVHEARAWGADMVLLIVAALEQPALESLVERVASLGMRALVEVHSRLEVLRAVDAGAQAVGINARDLRTLDVDRAIFAQVIDVVPSNVLVIAESGVRGPRDVFEYARNGADAVLVGESLVTSEQPQDLVADMVAAGLHPAVSAKRRPAKPQFKEN